MDIMSIRAQFPAFSQKVRGKDLVYLDSAATALKPTVVIDRITQFYKFETANVHRGAHYLSDRATQMFEDVRVKVKNWLSAGHEDEIVFTSGTTDGINLLATTLAEKYLTAGDEILLSEMEHHSNIVPWQIVAKKIGARVRFVKVNDIGEIDFADFSGKLSAKSKIVSLTHCSNVLGTVNDIAALAKSAHKVGAVVVVDAAQSITFSEINVQKLDCDFLVFSGHKMYGPYGIGVLWGKKSLLNQLPPYRGGGSMIREVTTAGATYLDSPHRFEAGTPNISGVIGLGAALDFMKSIGLEWIARHDKELAQLALSYLQGIGGLRWIGSSLTRVNLLSFVVEGVHSSDLGQILDQQGIALRTGHHCAQPLMQRFGITGTARISFGIYNTQKDIEVFAQGLKKAVEMLK